MTDTNPTLGPRHTLPAEHRCPICRYLRLDDTTWGYLCSAEERALDKTRGADTSMSLGNAG